MNNFSERLNKLQEATGLDKNNFSSFRDKGLIKIRNEKHAPGNYGWGTLVGLVRYKSGPNKGRSYEINVFYKTIDGETYIVTQQYENIKHNNVYLVEGSLDKFVADLYDGKLSVKPIGVIDDSDWEKSGPEYWDDIVKDLIKNKNFSEDQGVDTQVTDEESARKLGEALAKKMWTDKYDQNIFDKVFQSALKECGEDWDAVAAYLRNAYKGAVEMNNFSERLRKAFGC